ncbi:MAG: undecaprenyl-diphosphatase UppP [Tepidiformaceae bacterium]
MDDLVRAAILGIVQGLTEFLPISSSGHLILVPALFEWPDQGLAFDVGLHLGTLVALLAYFWRDWRRLLSAGLRGLARHGLNLAAQERDAQTLWLIALGCLPAAIAGLLLANWIEDNLRQPWLVAIMLAIAGAILYAADRFSRRDRLLGSLAFADAVAIGAAQACALIPGVSRSGATISAALSRGFTRDAAARFAFLLGTPTFIGAALLKSAELWGESGRDFGELAVGFTVSMLVGFSAIHWLLRYLRTRSLVPFVLYRFAVAGITLAIGAFRIA